MFLTMNRLIIGLFIILLAGAIIFHLERILFCDAAFILGRIINLDELQIQEHRYGSFITQGVPLLGSRLSIPLSVIVLLYSMSFNLFYLIVAFLLIYKFREWQLALLMSFYYVLFVTDTYFWTNNEVHQGIAWMFLFFATITWLNGRKASSLIFIPVFILLAFLSIFTHPLVLFPIIFLWIFFLLQKKWSFSRNEIILYSILLIAICAWKFMLSTSSKESHYDIDKLQNATDLSLRRILDALRSPLAFEIIKRTLAHYWIVPILFIAGAYSAWKQKKIWILAVTTFFCMAYFIAVCITFPDFITFYTESELMALSIISSSLFVYFTMPVLKKSQALWIIALIFLIRLVYIGFASVKWVERKDWIQSTLQVMKDNGIKKAIVHENPENKKTLIMNWGVPMESMIASALKGDQPQLTFVVGSPENISQRMPQNERQMIGSFEIFTNASMNKRYFAFDSTSSYQVLERR